MFAAEHTKYFELNGSKKHKECIVTVKSIMTQYKNSVITACLTNSLINLILSSKQQSLLCYVHTIYHLIQDFSNVFTDSVSQKFLCSEDVHHTIYLLKYIVKLLEESRKESDISHDKSVIKSQYYTSAEETSFLSFLT